MLSIYHIMLLAVCNRQVEKKVKKRFEKNEKNNKKKKYEKFAWKGFEPGPSESVRAKSWRLDYLGKCCQFEFKTGIYSFSMLIGSFPGWLSEFF